MMDTRQIARAGVAVALLAVSAWVSVPFGPVPFTLQTLALAVLPAALGGGAAVLAVGAYVLLGAVGMPVFAGFSGGVGALAGPTGGFLWGFILGMIVAFAVMGSLPGRLPVYARVLVADVAMLLVAYACGTVQLMAVTGMGLGPALAVAVVPFIIPDAVKLAVGARVGCAVARATGTRGE